MAQHQITARFTGLLVDASTGDVLDAGQITAFENGCWTVGHQTAGGQRFASYHPDTNLRGLPVPEFSQN